MQYGSNGSGPDVPKMLVRHVKEQDVRSLVAECQDARCRRSFVMDIESWSEDAPVLEIGRSLACPACGTKGMITRPNWFCRERPPA